MTPDQPTAPAGLRPETAVICAGRPSQAASEPLNNPVVLASNFHAGTTAAPGTEQGCFGSWRRRRPCPRRPSFLAAFAKRDRYDLGHADARPWLYGIATNLVGQHRRDEARQYPIRGDDKGRLLGYRRVCPCPAAAAGQGHHRLR